MEKRILHELRAEEVPYHARVYYNYKPIMGRNIGKGVLIYYKNELQKENDDMNEEEDTNDNNDGRNEYVKKAPLAIIRRAHKTDRSEDQNRVDSIFEYDHASLFINRDDQHSLENGWAINGVKIFHIWYISLNEKPLLSSYSVKNYEKATKKIEIEIRSPVKVENGASETEAKVVDFIIDTEVSDRPQSKQVNDYEVNYSLFSNACRVKIVINAYHTDGTSALNVNGKITAILYDEGLKNHKKTLFEKEDGDGKSEHITKSDTPLMSSVLILPGHSLSFNLELSLNDNSGEFVVNKIETVFPRNVCIDEQNYSLGEKGYILLTTFWGCLCVEQAPVVCTCPSGYALGNFQAESNNDGSSSDDDDYKDFTKLYTYQEFLCIQDGVKGGNKKAKKSNDSIFPAKKSE